MRSAQTKEPEINEDEEYTPPRQAWDLLDFIKAKPSEIDAKVVDCATCPVALLCQASIGGTGIVCRNCGATSVWAVDADRWEHVLVLDCNKHHFADEVREAQRQVECALCSGTAIKPALKRKPPFQHYIVTKHAGYSPMTRQKRLKEAHDKWLEHKRQVDTSAAKRRSK